MTNLNDIDVKNMDNDSLLDLVDELGSAYVKALIEATQRSNDKMFTDVQAIRITNIILNQTCNAYDSIEVTEEQMDIGTESIKKVIFDPMR